MSMYLDYWGWMSSRHFKDNVLLVCYNYVFTYAYQSQKKLIDKNDLWTAYETDFPYGFTWVLCP
jgi:hypothetical protein